jgi:hypothetical protein
MAKASGRNQWQKRREKNKTKPNDSELETKSGKH